MPAFSIAANLLSISFIFSFITYLFQILADGSCLYSAVPVRLVGNDVNFSTIPCFGGYIQLNKTRKSFHS